MMRMLIKGVFCLLVAVGLIACSAKKTDVIVFAASSMTETLEEIKEMYEADHPGVNLVFNFDSSGTLKTQIVEGADCDIFISAGKKQMDQIDIGENTSGLDFVEETTRCDFLENRIALCVPEGNPKSIKSFQDMADGLRTGEILVAMGNEDVPVGQYTGEILDFFGVSEEEISQKGSITYGTNVKEVTTQISEASVDCGVIYCTDAYAADLDIVDYATEKMCGKVIYPAAVLKKSGKPDEAKQFLEFLKSEKSMEAFKRAGFSKI